MEKCEFADLERLSFIKNFFCADNLASRNITFFNKGADINESSLAFLVKRFDKKMTTALPYVKNATCKWVGVAGEDGGVEELRMVLKSFIIPSFGCDEEVISFDKMCKLFDVNPSKDIVPKEYLVWDSIPKEVSNICRALELGFNLSGKRPSLYVLKPKGVFEILKEFQESLLARDWQAAELLLKEITERHLVSDFNVQFLKIQLLEVMGKWSDILLLPNIPDIVAIRLPLLVQKAIIKAIYYVNHSSLEAAGKYVASIERFRENQDICSSILRGAKPGSYWICDRLLAYRAAVLGDHKMIDAIIQNAEFADKPHLTEIRRVISGEKIGDERLPSEIKPEAVFAQKIINFEYEAACIIAQESKDPVESVKMFIRLASEAGSDSYVDKARKAFAALSEDDKSKVLGKQYFKNRAKDLCLFEYEIVVSDWIDWLDLVRSGQAKQGIIRDKAKMVKESWSPTRWISSRSQEFSEALLEIVTSDNESAQQVMADCYPFILSSFIDDDTFPATILLDTYKALFEIGVQTLACSKERAYYLLRLVEGICQLDPTFHLHVREDYLKWVMSGAGGMTKNFAESLYEIIEMLFEIGVPPEDLASIWVTSSAFISRLPSFANIDIKQIILWRNIGKCCQVAETDMNSYLPLPVGSAESVPEDSNLKSARLAIFTLMVHPAERVAKVLKESYPKIDITINSDQVATGKLEKLAKNADGVVLVTQAMKHAAFYQIKEYAPSEKIIYPQGRGSTSILEAIISWARQK